MPVKTGPRALRPAALEWNVFRGSDALARGLLTPHQLRGEFWTRIRRDVYADSRLDRDHALACRAALHRLAPGDAVIAGPSAAYLHGVDHAAGPDDDVHVIVVNPGLRGNTTGIRYHRPRLGTEDLCLGSPALISDGDPQLGMIGALPVTTGARAAWDSAIWLPLTPAVAIADGLLRQGAVTVDELAEVATRLGQEPGARTAAHVLGLADPGAASREESALRVGLVVAGLPRPIARPAIPTRDGGVVHPTLAWPDLRVALWYDVPRAGQATGGGRPGGVGTVGGTGTAPRLASGVGAGWRELSVTADRVRKDFPRLVRDVRDVLVAQGWRWTYRARRAVAESALSPSMR